MPERPLPTDKEVRALIHDRRNWGRWGKDDQLGAINLITPAKRATAARLVRTGRSVSLSRPFPKEPGPNNALPAQHYMRTLARGKGGFAADYYGIFYHGIASTHIDALCHTWDEEAMWNGRDPKKEITFDGATFGNGRGGLALYAVRAAEAERLFLLQGEANEHLGGALGAVQSAAGPLLIAGAPGWSDGASRTGRVLLIDLAGSIRSQTSGEDDREGYGAAVAGAGDVDGDGEADVLVGSQDPRPGGTTAGRVTVRRQDGSLLLRRDGTGGERLGGAVARAGDLDGDGFGDFLAAASGFLPSPTCGLEPPAGSAAGRVYVLRGGSTPVTAGGSLGAVLRTLTDGEAGAFFGASLALLSDLDGDGTRELAVSAPLSAQRGRNNAGRIDVFRGANGERLWSLGGHQAGDRLGHSLDATPDQDLDGAGDLLAGSHRREGEVVLFSLGDGDRSGERDACEPCAVPADLALDGEAAFTLTRVARRRCFRLEAPPGASFRLRVLAAAEGDSAVLFLRWGAPPESTLFDQSTTGGPAESPGLLIRSAPPVPAYIVVQAGKLRSRAASFRLEAEAIEGPTLFTMTPSRTSAGGGGEFFAAVNGAALPPVIDLALRPAAGGEPRHALDTLRVSPFRAAARFDLSGAAPGAYDLVAFTGQVEAAVLPRAFELTGGPGRHAYRVALRGPRLYRNNSRGRVTLRLENLGDTPLKPPLFELAGLERTSFGFPRGRGEFAERLQGLARSPLTPDGSLPPGGRIDIPVWFRRQADCAPESDDCALESRPLPLRASSGCPHRVG